MFYPIFLSINALIAIANNRERISNIKRGIAKQINHGLWFGIYSALCVPIFFINWKLGVAVFLQHGYFFPIFYNLIALGGGNAFHLSTTTEAKYDGTIVKIIDWLNKKFHAELQYSMFVPDLIICVTSLFFLWLY